MLLVHPLAVLGCQNLWQAGRFGGLHTIYVPGALKANQLGQIYFVIFDLVFCLFLDGTKSIKRVLQLD
jgi:hypothetical protein